MDIEIRHRFPCPPATFFDLLEGDELEALVRSSSSSRRVPVEARWEEDVFVRRTRIRPSRELPSVIGRMLGPDGLSYEQVVHTDRARGENRWWLEVARVGDRVRIGGTERIVPVEGGCELVSPTRIEVRAPLIAGRVEQAVAREIERVMGRRRDLVLQMLGTGHP